MPAGRQVRKVSAGWRGSDHGSSSISTRVARSRSMLSPVPVVRNDPSASSRLEAWRAVLQLPDLQGLRLEQQYVFLDLRGTCLSEASFGRDEVKAALLKHATRRAVVVSDACVERARG